MKFNFSSLDNLKQLGKFIGSLKFETVDSKPNFFTTLHVLINHYCTGFCGPLKVEMSIKTWKSEDYETMKRQH